MNLKVKYSKELLEKAAKDSLSIAQVITVLGLKQAGGTHSHTPTFGFRKRKPLTYIQEIQK